MRYVGLDVHKRVVQAHICDERGNRLAAMRFDLSITALEEFAKKQLGTDCSVALEASTNTWAVVDALRPHCAKVTVGNPLRTKAIAISKRKSDKVDAEALAQLLRCNYLPTVWIADAVTRQERTLASRRSALAHQMTWIKNRVHSVLHQRLIQAPFDPFTQRGRTWLEEIGLPEAVRLELATELRILDALLAEQKQLQALVERSAYANQQVRLLMTLPGVGASTAHAMMAAIGDVSRFDSADKLAAYFGLVPSVHQSAEHAYHGHITKQGNSNVRWLLVQSAQHAGRCPGPIGYQFSRIAKRKGVQVAKVAIARKLACIAWHMLRTGESYRYAMPASTEFKLAQLRRSQAVLLPKHKGNRGASRGRLTRVRKSLASVLQQESLPAPSLPPLAETKLLHDRGLDDFLKTINSTRRVRVTATGRALPKTADVQRHATLTTS
jgi:transposase